MNAVSSKSGVESVRAEYASKRVPVCGRPNPPRRPTKGRLSRVAERHDQIDAEVVGKAEDHPYPGHRADHRELASEPQRSRGEPNILTGSATIDRGAHRSDRPDPIDGQSKIRHDYAKGRRVRGQAGRGQPNRS